MARARNTWLFQPLEKIFEQIQMSPNLSPKYVLSQPRGGIPQQWSCWAAAQKISRYKYLSQYQRILTASYTADLCSLYRGTRKQTTDSLILLKVKVFKGKSARTISVTTRVMEAAPSEKAPHFCNELRKTIVMTLKQSPVIFQRPPSKFCTKTKGQGRCIS